MATSDKHVWAEALQGKTGKEYWRSLEELLDTPGFREAALGEFPAGADEPGGVSRREMLLLLGASLALGAAGCAREHGDALLPYTVPPPEVTPGIPNHYATSMTLDGFATGLVVEAHTGRPTKIEGNPDHPASLGSTGVFEQASILSLYDPHRATAYRGPGGPVDWDGFVAHFSRDRADRGAGLRFLASPTTSPLIADLVARVGRRFPEARFVFDSPARTGHAAAGAQMIFGRPLTAHRDLRRASVVLSLDSDFLAEGPFATRYARDFAARRRPASPDADMSRLYVVESMPSPTGSLADHRIRRRPGEIASFAASVAAELILAAGRAPANLPPDLRAALEPHQARVDAGLVRAISRDLVQNARTAVVIAGDRQPPIVHALVHLIHASLGDPDTAWLTEPVLFDPGGAGQSLSALAEDLRARRVDTLVILEENPVYTAPADLEIGNRISGVPDVVHCSLHENETSARASWLVPAAHYLEAWGDARAFDGTISLIQPLIQPLAGARTPSEILAAFAGEERPTARALLTELWSRRRSDPERFLEDALRRGLIPGTEAARARATAAFAPMIPALRDIHPPAENTLELDLRPSPSVHDGRFANNAWLLELPHPIIKLTWDNAAMMSPRTAARLGVATGDVVELARAGRHVQGPVVVVPGHADDAVTVELGYGRSGGEAVAAGVGFDAYPLRTSDGSGKGLSVRKLDGIAYPLARTQAHWTTDGRPIALAATLAEYRRDPDFTARERGPLLSLQPEFPREGSQWAMTIDLSICTGCSACVVACQAENNILVVGKEQVRRSREMHWIRIDSYYSGDPEDPSVVHQPMLCQHCEKAPCEYVCPVNATVHSPDGLNEMVYNRCIGTRFCSNNCPYKVRRFNWFDWRDREASNRGRRDLQYNPDVTVRERGVMEKCTYCVQRIRRAGLTARVEQRAIREGEVVTACQQACPTQAIQFDALHNTGSPMARWRREPRVFSVLHDLGARPRTRYLARIDNPNPEIR